MLAERLARHGLTVSAGALAEVLSHGAASARVPESLVSAAVVAAREFAAAGTAPARVAVLTQGVLKAMMLAKIKAAAAVVLALALAAACGLGLASPAAVAVVQAEQRQAAGRADGPGEADPRHRIFQWKIHFSIKNGKDYAEQLEALGATLAVPAGEGGRYRVIRDLG
jgi:hypothetical protein